MRCYLFAVVCVKWEYFSSSCRRQHSRQHHKKITEGRLLFYCSEVKMWILGINWGWSTTQPGSAVPSWLTCHPLSPSPNPVYLTHWSVIWLRFDQLRISCPCCGSEMSLAELWINPWCSPWCWNNRQYLYLSPFPLCSSLVSFTVYNTVNAQVYPTLWPLQ